MLPKNEEIAATEQKRLEAVRRYDILDTPPDGAFDRLTRLAARLLRTPIAIVSIVDNDRIWFKSRHGIDVEEVDRDLGLCASCILQDGPWIVTDARTDARALANPLVAGDFGLQFYLGIPLRTHDGYNLGALCVIDLSPRPVTDDESAVLSDLAGVVMDELELRLSARSARDNYLEEIARREDRIRGLARELAHRSKNLLAVVQAIARQTEPNSQTIADYVVRFSSRIQGLATTHELIAADDWKGVTLADLAERQLAPFLVAEAMQFHSHGPRLVLSPAATQNIGLALHELATNAVKYGALSVPAGKIDLAWSQAPPRLHLVWRERSGPPVKAPSRKGFGYLVLARLTPQALDGEARLKFDEDGLSWELDIPTTHAA